MTFNLVCCALNGLSMMGNLAFYAWGSHSEASLAIGIVNGFVMLLCAENR